MRFGVERVCDLAPVVIQVPAVVTGISAQRIHKIHFVNHIVPYRKKLDVITETIRPISDRCLMW